MLRKTGAVIWVEGIIGAGKSTLAKALAEALNLEAMYEPVESNPYLEDFYNDPKSVAFAMQIHLMHHRFAMQKIAAFNATIGKGSVLDRGMPGDRVFCKMHMQAGNITGKEWQTYQMAYEIMACSLSPPSILLFLDVEPDVALERVRKRSRGAESGITLKYLSDLRKGYLDMLSEVESGRHAWSQRMAVLRVPWNADDQPLEGLIADLGEIWVK